MATHSFRSKQLVPASLEQTWAFFSNPANLQQITPPDMGFRVISKFQDSSIYAGQLIEYTVSPLLGIPLYWMTEITHVDPLHYFVDEQRFGPYRFWQHQHHFNAVPGGVEMIDIVHYRLPLGWLGDLANRLFVREKLNRIFQYRFQAVESRFPAKLPRE